MEATSWLVEEQVKAVAMDSAKDIPDPAPVEKQFCPVNRTFLGPSVLFIGNYIGSVKIPDSRRFMIFATPSKIQGESEGPARVFLKIEV
jgi:kynurenine formamidase